MYFKQSSECLQERIIPKNLSWKYESWELDLISTKYIRQRQVQGMCWLSAYSCFIPRCTYVISSLFSSFRVSEVQTYSKILGNISKYDCNLLTCSLISPWNCGSSTVIGFSIHWCPEILPKASCCKKKFVGLNTSAFPEFASSEQPAQLKLKLSGGLHWLQAMRNASRIWKSGTISKKWHVSFE